MMNFLKRFWKKSAWRRISAVLTAVAITFAGVSLQSIAGEISSGASGDVVLASGVSGVSRSSMLLSLEDLWDFTVTIKDPSGTAKPTLKPGDTLTITLDFALTNTYQSKWSADIFNDPLIFYISRDAIESGLINLENPEIAGTTLKTFVSTGNDIRSEVEIGGKGYYKYTLVFDKDNIETAAKNGQKLFRITMSSSALLTEKINETTIFDLIYVEENGNLSYGYSATVEKPIDPEPEEDVVNSVTKRARYVFRQSVADGAYDTVVYDSSGGGNGTTNIPIQKDDFVVFQIAVKAKDKAYAMITKITDTLGSGYTFIKPNDEIKINVSGLSGSGHTTTLNDAATAKDANLTSFAYEWQADGGNVYSITYPTAAWDGKLAAGATKYFYLFAYVNDTAGNLTNNAEITTNKPGGPGPGSVTIIPTADSRDMTLRLAIARTYDSDGTQLSSTEVSSATIKEGGYLRVSAKLNNQSNIPTQSVTVRYYVPAGLEVRGALGANWTHITTEAPNTWAGTPWSDLKIYQATYSTKINASGDSGWQLNMNLNVLNQLPDGTPINPKDNKQHYYIAAEIVSFTDTYGNVITAGPDVGTAGGTAAFFDADSTPDTDPTNDLLGSDIWSGDHEKAATYTQNRYKLSSGLYVQDDAQDEDDFDFVWVSGFTSPGEWNGGHGTLDKKVADTATAKSIFENVGGKNIPNASKYVPLPANGVASNAYTYVVYEIDINYDGLVKLHEKGMGELVDTIPNGVELLRYQKDSKTYYGFGVQRITGSPKVALPDGRTYIDRSNSSFYRTTNLKFENHDIYSGYTSGTAASTYGVRAKYDVDNRELSLKFEESVEDDGVAYRLYVVCLLDSNLTESRKEINNVVSLTYGESKTTVSSSKEIIWSYDAATAAIDKFVVDQNGDRIAGAYQVLEPAADHRYQVSYRIELPSNGKIAAGTVKFADRPSPLRYYEGIVNDVRITSPSFTGVTVNTTFGGFDAVNAIETPATATTHKFDFTFQFEDVPYGTVLRNTAIVSAHAVVPLRLNLEKLDGEDNSIALRDYVIKAYYANQDGSVDYNAPVQDVNGAEIEFTDSADSFDFIPRRYTTQMTNSTWDIILVEETAPAGYENGVGLQVPVQVTSDASGNLSVTKDSLAGLYGVENDTYGETGITVYNNKDLVRARIEKVDGGGKPLPSPTPQSPITFTITPLNGGKETRLQVDEHGRTGNVDLLPGSYRIEELESTVPDGYDPARRAVGELEVYRDSDDNQLKIRLVGATNLSFREEAGVFTITAVNHKRGEQSIDLYLYKIDKESGEPLDAPIVFDIQRYANGAYTAYQQLTVGADGRTNSIALAEGRYKAVERTDTMPDGYNRALSSYGEFTVAFVNGKPLVQRLTDQPSRNFAIKADSGSVYYIEAANEKRTTPNTDRLTTHLRKVDSNGNTVTAAIQFTVTPEVGSATTLTVGSDGRTQAITLTPGVYTVEEVPSTMPSSYVRSSYAYGTVIVRENGDTLEMALDTARSHQNLSIRGDGQGGYYFSAVNVRSSGGGGNDGGGSSTPDTPRQPTTPTTPTTPGGSTEGGGSSDGGRRNRPETNFTPIGDIPVPLVDLPFVDIFDDGVPLTSLPLTGGDGSTPLSMAAFGASALLLAAVIRRKKK